MRSTRNSVDIWCDLILALITATLLINAKTPRMICMLTVLMIAALYNLCSKSFLSIVRLVHGGSILWLKYRYTQHDSNHGNIVIFNINPECIHFTMAIAMYPHFYGRETALTNLSRYNYIHHNNPGNNYHPCRCIHHIPCTKVNTTLVISISHRLYLHPYLGPFDVWPQWAINYCTASTWRS